ncbi:MAG TPA: cellulase family glycosylhydrolase [Solirubrobacteraceae bacterium]|nr:cellulase family glycosylhydrolase [Solirubrobacteraceae bacterium]
MRLRPPSSLIGPALVCALGAVGTIGAAPSAQAAAPNPPAISVQGPELLRNGVPWVPRGVQIVGLVAPDPALSGKYIPAHAHFGAAELETAVADHVDVVRFQVSEFGLDPEGPLYSPSYIQEVQSGVETARALGLAVIMSLQAEPPAGEPSRCPLPDAGAARTWDALAATFAGDSGVMFELYNEPAVAPTATDWALWRNGGQVIYPSGMCQAVGMQTLVDAIRTVAPDNVVIVPGLAGEQSLAGMSPIADPSHPGDPQIAYGIHYPSLARGSTSWDRAFGAISARVPVVISEWDANATTNCLPDAPARAQLLLDYLASKRIGIVGFAFDLPGTVIADWSYAPTSYSDFACGNLAGGPGQVLFPDYAAEAQAGDGAQADPAPGWVVSASDLTHLRGAAPIVTGHFFNTPRTFVTGASTATLSVLGMSTAVPTESFASAAALAAAAGAGRLRPGTQAVVYAAAHTRSTPVIQQRHLARYYELAAQVAHAHGLLFIAAPAASLVSELAPHTPAAGQEKEFLKLRVAAQTAAFADVYEAQTQTLQTSPAAYAAFVAAASSQAARAHPGIELLAGLNAGSPGHRVAATTLLDAYLNTRLVVSGYGFADPADRATSACSMCAGRFRDPGPGFLRTLARLDG